MVYISFKITAKKEKKDAKILNTYQFGTTSDMPSDISIDVWVNVFFITQIALLLFLARMLIHGW